VLLAGCGPGRQPPGYEDDQGFRLTPPPGWSERARPGGAAGRAPAHARAEANLPLPPLGGAGRPVNEQLQVRYDRPRGSHSAWLRVTAADLPASFSLEAYLAARTPGPAWRRESAVEPLEVGGLPAARVAFAGRWDNQDYLCEAVGVRKGEKAYFITASFPASDGTAREQVRQAVAAVTWR
jgi:hypothetical protein